MLVLFYFITKIEGEELFKNQSID